MGLPLIVANCEPARQAISLYFRTAFVFALSSASSPGSQLVDSAYVGALMISRRAVALGLRQGTGRYRVPADWNKG